MTSLEFMILALAAYRCYQLVSDDTILDRPRDWLTRKLDRESEKFSLFITCPWCAGFWISVGWALAFWADERAVWVAVPFAFNAVLVLAYSAIEALQAYEDNLPG